MNKLFYFIVFLCIIWIAIILVEWSRGLSAIKDSIKQQTLGGARRRRIDKNNIKPTHRDVEKDLKKYPASKFENNIRSIFEKITSTGTTKYKFPTVLPTWLKSPDGSTMELDGYSEELGLAFEAQGPLHFKYVEKIDGDYANYYKRLLADKTKVDTCAKHGTTLIQVPYQIPKHLLPTYIVSRIYDALKDEKIDYRKLPESLRIQPNNYMQPQTFEPWRNAVYEKELNLIGL